MKEKLNILYTICFCISGDNVLMLHRAKPPLKDKWNGVGGKIDEGESHRDAVVREVLEETGLDVTKADELTFQGIVTWDTPKDRNNHNKGMYIYTAHFSDRQDIQQEYKNSREGNLEWKLLEWACDKSNSDVPSNVPHYLSDLLKKEVPKLYHCFYNEDGEFIRIETQNVPQGLS